MGNRSRQPPRRDRDMHVARDIARDQKNGGRSGLGMEREALFINWQIDFNRNLLKSGRI